MASNHQVQPQQQEPSGTGHGAQHDQTAHGTSNAAASQDTTGSKNSAAPRTGRRGFAGMDAARQREIASQGGRAAHLSGNAHQFTPEEARAAGSKGGQASRRSTRSTTSTAPNGASPGQA